MTDGISDPLEIRAENHSTTFELSRSSGEFQSFRVCHSKHLLNIQHDHQDQTTSAVCSGTALSELDLVESPATDLSGNPGGGEKPDADASGDWIDAEAQTAEDLLQDR
jgi:hypothetical protein